MFVKVNGGARQKLVLTGVESQSVSFPTPYPTPERSASSPRPTTSGRVSTVGVSTVGLVKNDSEAARQHRACRHRRPDRDCRYFFGCTQLVTTAFSAAIEKLLRMDDSQHGPGGR